MTVVKFILLCLSIVVTSFSWADVSMKESRCQKDGHQRNCLVLKDFASGKQFTLLPFKDSKLEYEKLKSEVQGILRRGEAIITNVFPRNAATLQMGEAALTFTFKKGGSAHLDQSTMDLRYLTRKLQDCEASRGSLRALGDALGVTEDNCSRGSIVESNRGSVDPKSIFRFENYGKELPTRYGSEPTVRSQ